MRQLETLVWGFGAPWHGEAEVVTVTLNGRGFAALPSNMLLRNELPSTDWSAPVIAVPAPEMVLCRSAASCVLCEDVPQLREVEEARRRSGEPPESWFPAGEGAMWRTGRALILVNLDELQRGVAESAAKYALGDFGRAVVWGEREKAIQEGFAQEWNSETGTFRTSAETRKRFEAERRRAIERLGSAFYRMPVHRRRLSYIGPEVVQRAEERKTSPWVQVMEARRRALELVLPQVVGGWFEGWRQRIRASRNPVRMLRRGLSDSLTELVKAVKQPLNNAVTEDFCPGPRQQFEQRREQLESELPHDLSSYAESTEGDDFATALDREDRRSILDEVVPDLSPRERDLLAAIRSGLRPTEWARMNRLSDGTVHAMCSRIRDKARKLLLDSTVPSP